MNISSTITLDSELYPEVRFTIRRLSLVARADLDMGILPLLQLRHEIQSQIPPMEEEEIDFRQRLDLTLRKINALLTIKQQREWTDDEQVAHDAAAKLFFTLQVNIQKSIPEDDRRKRANLEKQAENVDARIWPHYIRAALVSIEHLTVDNEPVTPATLPETPGISRLCVEIFEAIQSQSGLTGAEAKNSLSPSTLAEVEPKATSDSTAQPADIQAIRGTSSATA